jgi:hypothetical protein
MPAWLPWITDSVLVYRSPVMARMSSLVLVKPKPPCSLASVDRRVVLIGHMIAMRRFRTQSLCPGPRGLSCPCLLDWFPVAVLVTAALSTSLHKTKGAFALVTCALVWPRVTPRSGVSTLTHGRRAPAGETLLCSSLFLQHR